MAEQQHTTAFVVGAIVGGLAGASVTLWQTPRSGEQTRTLIAEQIEGVLFKLTGMNEWQAGDMQSAPSRSSAGNQPSASPLAEPFVVPEFDGAMATLPDPLDAAPIEPVAEPVMLPHTFRGEVLSEKGSDVVLDGPRPAPNDR